MGGENNPRSRLNLRKFPKGKSGNPFGINFQTKRAQQIGDLRAEGTHVVVNAAARILMMKDGEEKTLQMFPGLVDSPMLKGLKTFAQMAAAGSTEHMAFLMTLVMKNITKVSDDTTIITPEERKILEEYRKLKMYQDGDAKGVLEELTDRVDENQKEMITGEGKVIDDPNDTRPPGG